MDQPKPTTNKAKNETPGLSGAPKSPNPGDGPPQVSTAATNTASKPNGTQPDPPTASQSAGDQQTSSATKVAPSTTPADATELAIKKPVATAQEPKSASKPLPGPEVPLVPSNTAQTSTDVKQKDPGDAAKPKVSKTPSGLPEFEHIEQKHLGLRQLVAPPETEDIDADVVFVHGIGAHPYNTWRHKITKTNWLDDKTMLPADLPKSRILFFGYQSAWYGPNAVRQTVNTAADQLLNALMGRLRENCPERPIIFVAHCFGGLIVQRAFHIAHSHRSNFPGLIDAITGLIFLGTPHSGVDGNSSLSTQGDIYRAIVAAQVKTHFETLETMTHNNQMLHGIVQDFNQVLKNEVKVQPHIYSFFEMYASSVGKIAGMGNMPQEFVVTQSSATVYGHGSTGLNANHFNMNTFEDNQDANYDAVCQQIVRMVKLARENQEKRKQEDSRFSQSHSHLPHLAKLPIPIRKDGHFVERADILGLIDRKFHDENGAVVALTGGLGTGKTHVAVEYAYRYCIENPGAHIHWIDASSAEQFEFSYKRIADGLQFRLRDANSPQDVVRDVCHALKKSTDSQWLMVVDGLDDDASLNWIKDGTPNDERTLWDFIPRGRHSTVLVTTREARLARRFAGKPQFVIDVAPLSGKDAAFMILGRKTTDKQKYDQAKELAKKLGGTAGALALPHAYRTKVDGKINLKEYEDMLKLPESQKQDTTGNAVLAWRRLFRVLEKKHRDAANLLCSVGVLDVQSIPKDFFQKADWKLTRTLEVYGMIERSADDRFIRVTGIVRLCLQRYLEEAKEKELVEEKVLDQLSQALKDGDHELDDALLPSILAALRFQPKHSDGKKAAAILHLKVAQYYQQIGRLEVARTHFEKALTPRPTDPQQPPRYFLTAKDVETARQALGNLGLDQKTMPVAVSKKPSSRACFIPNPQELRSELRFLEESSGREHTSTIQKLAELAVLRLAHPSARQPSKTKANNLANTRGLPATTSGSPAPGTLGNNNPSDNGSFSSAPQSEDAPEDDPAVLFERLLESAINTHGPNTMRTANAHYSLAIAYERQEDFPKSEQHFSKAIAIARDRLGPESPECLRMLRALACLYARQGNTQAEQMFALTLQNQIKVLGDTHPETLITRHNVALFLEEAEEWEAAGQELERILGLQGYWLGRDAPETLHTAQSLALNYAARNKRKEAEDLFRATLATQEQVLGETHVDTMTTAERLREFLENAQGDGGKGDKGAKKEDNDKKGVKDGKKGKK
ncbi:hypothetical protein QC764_0035160 [Podospora pseudoanserina]|uniref:DUF676 domain-containing protein n=1 Tax=Podospora pseudoanserina TaxID=2609844 RepID=A0ABR0IH68_9PEZI|nr:hypothetical protein QC764_0035160 [Podospora pseudoanserina]